MTPACCFASGCVELPRDGRGAGEERLQLLISAIIIPGTLGPGLGGYVFCCLIVLEEKGSVCICVYLEIEKKDGFQY
jgi:hypothetical protein